MNYPDIPTLSLADLLQRRKYRNAQNLCSATLRYYQYQSGLFNFKSDIVNTATNTMAFRLIQRELNSIRIERTCTAYVFPDVNNQSEDDKINKRVALLISQRQSIVNHYSLLPEYLDCPPEKTAQRFIATMENWKGYKTYGDYENMLASYLGVFCSKSGFLACLDHLSEYIDRDPRSGLSLAISTSLESFFEELDVFIKKYQQE